jgi:hypothetical protein
MSSKSGRKSNLTHLFSISNRNCYNLRSNNYCMLSLPKPINTNAMIHEKKFQLSGFRDLERPTKRRRNLVIIKYCMLVYFEKQLLVILVLNTLPCINKK